MEYVRKTEEFEATEFEKILTRALFKAVGQIELIDKNDDFKRWTGKELIDSVEDADEFDRKYEKAFWDHAGAEIKRALQQEKDIFNKKELELVFKALNTTLMYGQEMFSADIRMDMIKLANRIRKMIDTEDDDIEETEYRTEDKRAMALKQMEQILEEARSKVAEARGELGV